MIVTGHDYNNQSPRKKGTMLLLCLFLGIFGIHRFYVGKYFTGILYALTMGLGYFGILFDLIMIVMGKFTDSDGKLIS
nr:TM2 domain-containing protein [Treponema denticola]